jgi:hypothetical protein
MYDMYGTYVLYVYILYILTLYVYEGFTHTCTYIQLLQRMLQYTVLYTVHILGIVCIVMLLFNPFCIYCCLFYCCSLLLLFIIIGVHCYCCLFYCCLLLLLSILLLFIFIVIVNLQYCSSLLQYCQLMNFQMNLCVYYPRIHAIHICTFNTYTYAHAGSLMQAQWDRREENVAHLRRANSESKQ